MVEDEQKGGVGKDLFCLINKNSTHTLLIICFKPITCIITFGGSLLKSKQR